MLRYETATIWFAKLHKANSMLVSFVFILKCLVSFLIFDTPAYVCGSYTSQILPPPWPSRLEFVALLISKSWNLTRESTVALDPVLPAISDTVVQCTCMIVKDREIADITKVALLRLHNFCLHPVVLSTSKIINYKLRSFITAGSRICFRVFFAVCYYEFTNRANVVWQQMRNACCIMYRSPMHCITAAWRGVSWLRRLITSYIVKSHLIVARVNGESPHIRIKNWFWF